MNILITTLWYPSKQNHISGIFVKEYAKAIKLYNEVKVVPPPAEIHNLNKLIEIKESTEDGIDVIRIYYKKFNFRIINSFLTYFSVLKLIRLLIKKKWKPDIIHGNVFLSCLAFIPIKFLYKIPLIVSEHWSYIITRKLTFKNIILMKLIYSIADMVLPVSEELCRNINTYINVEKKCRVVYNTVNTNFFYLPKKKVEKKRKEVIAIGGLVEIKGFNRLIEAIALIVKTRTDLHLTIVGDGPLLKHLENRIKDLNVSKFVTLAGSKTKDEINKLFDKSDFLVLSSFAETFGVVVIEAMAKGLPVIVTKCGGPENFVKSFCGIVIKNNSPEKLADSICYMLDNYNKYDSVKISDYVKNNFSYETIGYKFNYIYDNIIGKNKE